MKNVIWQTLYRAMLSMRGTSHVSPSQVGIPLKQLNVGSHKQNSTRVTPYVGPMQVRWIKIGDF